MQMTTRGKSRPNWCSAWATARARIAAGRQGNRALEAALEGRDAQPHVVVDHLGARVRVILPERYVSFGGLEGDALCDELIHWVRSCHAASANLHMPAALTLHRFEHLAPEGAAIFAGQRSALLRAANF